LRSVRFLLRADLTTVEAYDAVSDTWSTKASMPSPRRGLGTAVVNGVIYAIGGITGSPLGTVEAYDPANNTWSTKASMPSPRQTAEVGVVNGIIYVVGGLGPGNSDISSSVFAYNPSTDTWATKTSAPVASLYGTASVVNGVLYVAGGVNSFGSIMPVYAYDPASDTWSTRASIPAPLQGPTSSTLNGLMYVLGGGAIPGGIATGTAEAYDPISDAWTAVAPMPTPREFPSASTVNNVIYAIGGYDSSGVVRNTVEAFTPLAPLSITSLTATPNTLWPPNHKLIPVTLAVTTSGGSGPVSCKIINVVSNEPVDPDGDWSITGNLSLSLRAERLGHGNGRTYSISVQCGGTGGITGTVTVTVSHDQGH
jgi:N-acetylneuraminic acid mutarotase